MKIWCLFSVENLYDQPPNNLVAWWSQKPSIEQLGQFLCCPLDGENDDGIACVVDVWRGKPTSFDFAPHYAKSYRLEEVAEGGVG